MIHCNTQYLDARRLVKNLAAPRVDRQVGDPATEGLPRAGNLSRTVGREEVRAGNPRPTRARVGPGAVRRDHLPAPSPAEGGRHARFGVGGRGGRPSQEVLPPHPSGTTPSGADGPRLGAVHRKPRRAPRASREGGSKGVNRSGEHPEIERFIDGVRSRLRGTPAAQVDEILLELRGHSSERLAAGRGVAEAIESLGDPADLADEYRTERVATRAQCSGSPIVVLHSLLLLRRGRFTGWVVLAFAAFGYVWAFA